MDKTIVDLGFWPTVTFYSIAVFASLAIELTALLRDVSANNGVIPDRYRTVAFPLIRLAFAFLAAGPLAIILGSASVAAAFYIGATAPLIFDRAAAGIKYSG